MTDRELQELLKHIAGLPQRQLERLRKWIGFPALDGGSGNESLFGSISDEDARAMNLAIGEAFEQVEADGGPSRQ